MPDSMGKRQRRDVKARKAAAIEQRRVARAQRKEDRAAGLIEAGPPLSDEYGGVDLSLEDAPEEASGQREGGKDGAPDRAPDRATDRR
jgi:hypothetical protein